MVSILQVLLIAGFATAAPRPTRSPVSKRPTKAPNQSTIPTFSPIMAPSRPTSYPTLSPTVKTHYFTLTLTKQTLNTNGALKAVILVNGQTPGPELRVPLGDYIDVTVINNIGNDMSTIHWHGMTQEGTTYFDGAVGANQCPINTINPVTGLMLDPMNSVTQLRYTFKPASAGTFWYHGHYEEQTIDGIVGPLIVVDSPAITQAYAANGVTYTAETTIIITDFYNQPGANMLPFFLSPASLGNEPMPDKITVNNMLTGKMVINVNKADKLRVRVINGASFSMFNVAVDGMPLTVIEMDGAQTIPFDVSYVPVNVAQRTSFILDWAKLPRSMSTSSSVLFRVDAIKTMYPTYNPLLPNGGLIGTTSGAPFSTSWNGRFRFNELAAVNGGRPNYGTRTPPLSTALPPSDTNMLQALPLIPVVVPVADLNMQYLIEFYADAAGVNRPHINGVSWPGFTKAELGNPLLFQYMSATGGPLQEPVGLPVGASIPGDGVNPFVIPFGRTIDILITNTDAGEHPMHLHGHTFWVMKTSEFDSGHGVLRDTVSVPALGWALIRFEATNPGVWLMHCHIDWHFKAGMSAVIIEAPSKLKGTINNIPVDHKAACKYVN